MSKGATFDRALREKAKAEDKGLIMVDVDNRHGRWQFWGAIEHSLAANLWTFCHMVYTGKTPREAMEEVWPEQHQ